nr:hypothetical protein CFP56_21127 [Quercus suber]
MSGPTRWIPARPAGTAASWGSDVGQVDAAFSRSMRCESEGSHTLYIQHILCRCCSSADQTVNGSRGGCRARAGVSPKSPDIFSPESRKAALTENYFRPGNPRRRICALRLYVPWQVRYATCPCVADDCGWMLTPSLPLSDVLATATQRLVRILQMCSRLSMTTSHNPCVQSLKGKNMPTRDRYDDPFGRAALRLCRHRTAY